MGVVIQLPRRNGGSGEPPEPPDPPAPPLEKPDPVGVTRAAVAHGWRRVKFEVFASPRRGFRLVRYFYRGVLGHRDSHGFWVGGWLGLLNWCLAMREREDARHIAGDKPGHQLAATERADHIAVMHSAAVIAPHLAMLWAAQRYLGMWWLTLIPLVVATTIYGWRVDPRPPSPLTPHKPGDVTRESIDAALRAVGILDKPTTQRPTPDGVRLVRLPRVVGHGQELIFDLPPSVKSSAMDVVQLRGRIAASLQIPFHQLHIEPGEHPGRVVLWHGRTDPFAGTPVEHPLLDSREVSVFNPIAIGTDSRSRPVSAPLIGTNWLIGGAPNSGKSSAARSLVAGAVLDPDCDLYVFDGKGGADWSALDGTAVQYESGPAPEQARLLRDRLVSLREEGDRRFQWLKTLPPEVCPDYSLTPEVVRRYGVRPQVVILDEGHRHLEDETHGKEITKLAVNIVKGYRACGIVLILVTQSADALLDERFTALRRELTTRMCMRVMSWLTSNMILGDKMNTRGFDASEIGPDQRGTGILRADLEVDGGAKVEARWVRSYYMDSQAWRAICEVGKELRTRRPEPELDPEPESGPADELLTATELLDRIRLLAPETLPEAVTHPQAVGEWLSSRGVRTEDRKRAGQRVRSRVSVEGALGLPVGCLLLPEEVPGGEDWAPEGHLSRHPVGTSGAGG